MLAPLIALSIAWDPSPETSSYRVWRGIEVVAAVERPEAAIRIPADEPVVLTVTAINAAGESAHSSPFHVQLVTREETLTVQGSADLVEWHDIPRPGDAFFRVKREPKGHN